ncbi:MAG: Rpn family recombination-promoting nuclease/putative transposase [Rivularia sp. T60_A2020_040]|nr:Rpn family recombination-promoting nuclease/putative transposase [Rivularia sp. T60_A2020_040]
MKTDKIFYKLFGEFPEIFFELIGKPPTTSNLYEFKSQEIKETSFRLNGIFITLNSLNTTTNEPIYFVEVQCYKDKLFYDRFLTSILLYFYQYQPSNPHWYAIVIFDTRKNDVDYPQRLDSLKKPHLRCFYLDEMERVSSDSLGLGIIKLIVEENQKAKISVKQLVDKAKLEVKDAAIQRKVLELIEAILVNKFPNLNREEIKEMLSLELIKGTRYYEELKEEVRGEVKEEVRGEVKEEVKIGMIAKLLQRGMSVEEIADILELDVEFVRKIVEDN